MADYLFDKAHEAAADRFTALEQRYDPVTVDRLDALGVPKGARCLEIGAGGGSIARWLADRVGASGSVLATDIDVSKTVGGPGNLTIRKHDIVSGDLPERRFDVVHARLVLIHLARTSEGARGCTRGWQLPCTAFWSSAVSSRPGAGTPPQP